MSCESEEMMSDIKKRALVFALDNYEAPTALQIASTETLMLIGASIAQEHFLRLLAETA